MTWMKTDGIPPTLCPFFDVIEDADRSSGQNAAEFFESALFDHALDRFGRGLNWADLRAVMSAWSMHYFAAIIIPITTAVVCCDRVVALALDDVEIDIDDDGLIRRIFVRPQKRPQGRRFESLIADHVGPVIRHCCKRSGVSPRVLWNNAAVMFDYSIDEIVGSKAVVSANALEDALAVLRGMHWPEMRYPYNCDKGRGFRTRRICCLRYKLPGHDVCPGICPLFKKLETSDVRCA